MSPCSTLRPNVLKLMKRGRGLTFPESIEKMRATIPNVTLRSSFIVGFPGETEQDFEELCEFVKAAKFDWLGAFSYSDQDGAKAYALDEKVPVKEIERRRKKLMSIQKQISRKAKKSLVGREFDILIEGPSEESDLLWEGRTAMHAPEIDGKVFIADFGDHENVQPASSIAAKSRKRTNMTSLPAYCNDVFSALSGKSLSLKPGRTRPSEPK